MALWLTLVAAPASAHDTLVDSYPQEQATLSEVPEELVLDFSGEISEMGVQFMVTGPDGRDVIMGTPTVEGTTVTQGLAEELVDGDYVIAWRVTSSDGHPISGEIPFTIAAGGANDPAGEDESATTDDTAAEATDDPTDEAPGDTTGDPADTPEATGDDPAATSDDAAGAGNSDAAATETDDISAADAPAVSDNEIPAWGWAVAALAVVGLVACGFLAFRRN